MNKYEVIGRVNGSRKHKPKHVIRALDDFEAWEKFCRAYGRDKCTMVDIKRIKEEPEDDREAILALLSDGRARTSDDIEETLGLPMRRVAGIVSALVRGGGIERIGTVGGLRIYRIQEAAE